MCTTTYVYISITTKDYLVFEVLHTRMWQPKRYIPPPGRGSDELRYQTNRPQARGPRDWFRVGLISLNHGYLRLLQHDFDSRLINQQINNSSSTLISINHGQGKQHASRHLTRVRELRS